MHRSLRLACLLAVLCSATAHGEDTRDELLRKLEERAERAGREAGPSIVCIYVSRSRAYAHAPFWGSRGKPEYPGQLGRFDAEAARKRVPADAPGRKRILRAIADHDLSDPLAIPESYGSGFVLDKSGLILTAAHVVRNSTRIYVRFPGNKGSWADIHASDPRSDLAVLKLLDPPADLKPLTLGDGGTVRRLQIVFCLVNSFAPGFRRKSTVTTTWGGISNLRQRAPSNLNERDNRKLTLHHYGTLLELDASTTPGCSGGTLLDLSGKVIGLTTALAGIRGDRPGGLAIPFDSSTRQIVEVLKRGEEVEYGFLGVRLQEALGRGGVRLGGIVGGTPAARAGLLPNDLVVSINGKPVRHQNDLFLYVSMTLAGNPARIEVSRGNAGVLRTYTVRLAKFDVPGPIIASRRPPAKFGLRVDYTSVLTQRNPFPWRGPPEGVTIREVVPGSPADQARLQPDKIITQVNGRRVTTPAQYYREVARTGNKVELTVLTSNNRPERITLQNK